MSRQLRRERMTMLRSDPEAKDRDEKFPNRIVLGGRTNQDVIDFLLRSSISRVYYAKLLDMDDCPRYRLVLEMYVDTRTPIE